MFVLFFLSCALLCGAVLTADLSEQFAASNDAIQKEQSRLLAKSGWNLVLEQLQLYGSVEPIQRIVSVGTLDATIVENSDKLAAWDVESLGTAGAYCRTVSGTVQCFPFPFLDTKTWTVVSVQQIADLTEASIVLLDEAYYQLTCDSAYSLGFTSVRGNTTQIEIVGDITLSELYVYGDLYVTGTLVAEQIYVTGEIIGEENIQCDKVHSGYVDDLPYQIRVLARKAV